MAEKKSFRDTILIVFVVLVCFGLTIYGIVFLLGATKVSAPDAAETITNQFVTPKVITDPNDGAVMSFTDNNTGTEAIDNKPTAIVPEPTPAPAKATEPVAKPVEKKPAAKPVEKKPAVKAEPKKEAAKPAEKKPVTKTEPKKEVVADKPAADDTDETPAPAPVAQAPGKFVLQLMALRSEPDAYAAMNKYKSVCPDIYVTRVEIKDNGIWYRVRCGVTDSMDEALVLKQRFANDFKINADIIKNQK